MRPDYLSALAQTFAPSDARERMILSLAFIKLVLVSWFFISVSLINAAQAEEITGSISSNQTSCSGNNLITEMKANQPEEYAAMRTEADQLENGGSIFWKVEKAGIPTSWLLGTMHMSDPRIANWPDTVGSALANARSVIVESTDAMDEKKAQLAMASLKHLTFLTDGSTLEQVIPQELIPRLQSETEQRAVPWFLAKRMQPWVIATTISLPLCEMQLKQTGAPVLDKKIADYALSNDKPLVGLETIEEQFTAIATLPADYHVSSLTETLRMGPGKVQDMVFTMKELYLSGNIDMLVPLMKRLSPHSFDGEGMSNFMEQLIVKRNHVMAERSEAEFNAGGTFMAVGAMHLPGPDGVVKLLRDQGYTVTAMAH